MSGEAVAVKKAPERDRPKEALRRLVSVWTDRLWLNQWRIWANLVDEETGKPRENGTAGVCNSSADYQELTLGFLRRSWAKSTPRRRNEIVCHEMTHGLLSPLREFIVMMLDREEDEKARDELYRWWHSVDERMTTHLANVFLNAAREIEGSARGKRWR